MHDLLLPHRNARRSIPIGKIRTAFRSARLSSVAAAQAQYLSFIRRSTGAPACMWAQPWVRKPPQPPQVGWAKCAATRWRCCRSAAIIWVTTFGTGSACSVEVIGHEGLFSDLHDHLPPEMICERELFICRL